DLSKSQIAPPPNMSSEIQNRYIIGVGKYADKIILILDSNKVLSEDEIDDISSGL
ncbi:MAG: chemotaxis protein CheW, partial [Clostridiales bacterium]|nr:chemotaxis protein CheW [Clostridiales bacterium]